MSRKLLYAIAACLLLVLSIWAFWDSDNERTDFSERVKVSLRDVGNQLLLSDQDSTSLVLPVLEVAPSKYEVSFEKPLSFDPNSLVSIVSQSFQKSQLPTTYGIEVMQCSGGEVAYSYAMTPVEATTIIPCMGRLLPEDCYTLQVRFEAVRTSENNRKKTIFFTVLFALALIILIDLVSQKGRQAVLSKGGNPNYAAIGSFKFYPTQNKLVKEAEEINLSKKECELLALFVAQPNQVIKRDELTKRVWEDNGVIVGRSLDTYISKLRKKLQGDDRIKITNVHGVGYKLEVNL